MIEENLRTLNEKILYLSKKLGVNPPKLVAVSKNHSIEAIREAYQCGQRDFGENRVQELISKVPHLPNDIRWHHIGNLQTNKVKYIVDFIHCIHSVDSEKLLAEINKHALKHQKKISVFIQINISNEPQKHGCSYAEAIRLFEKLPFYANVMVMGLMGIAEDTEDRNKIAQQFKKLSNFFEECKIYENEQIKMQELCIGMSGDYELAIEAKSTMLRIGTAIFGQRS
jgi:pyridoxal phosphate enzyme (YggS family)